MPAANQGPMQLLGGQQGYQTASWFAGAPITKLCAVATVVCYVLFHARSAQSAMAMDSFQMLRATQYAGGGSQWHRYWTSKITFGSTGELIMGGTLLTVLARQYERELGSRKFGVFLIITNAVAIMLEVMCVGLSTMMENGYRYQGPYALLGGLMYLFHRFSPRLHPRFFGILGFTFSEKSFHYLWFFQVVGYGGTNTILAASLGIIAAYVYIVSNMHETLDLPEALAKPLTNIGAHLSEPPPRILAPTNHGGRGDPMAGMQRMMRNNPAGQAAAAAAAAAQRPAAPPAAPDPAAIEQLTSMGFERQQVVNALQATNNSVERAANLLLAG